MFPVLCFAPRRPLTLCATLLAVGVCTAPPLRAVLPSSAAIAANASSPGVHRLFLDLKAIQPGAIVTDEQKQTLADDLAALATGLVKPSSSSLDQLADDLAEAAASGLLTHRVERILAHDLDAILDRSRLDAGSLRALVAEAETILAAYGLDAADVQQIATDLRAIIDGFQTDSVSTRRTINLRAENVPVYLLMDYAGIAKLTTVSTDGEAPQSVLTVAAYGLPPSNPYTVAVTRRSDGRTLALGKLTVHAGLPVTTLTEIIKGFPLPWAEIASYGVVEFGGAGGKALPEGFDPADVDTLTLTDANGTERLAGGFADAGDLRASHRLVNLRLDAGTADADAAGTVSFRVKTTPARTREAFLLYVSGLPAEASVTLVADGVAAGTFATTRQGRLVIARGNVPVPTKPSGRMLPVNALPAAVDLNTLNTLTLLDAAGHVLASGNL